jgi:hypothetical protein
MTLLEKLIKEGHTIQIEPASIRDSDEPDGVRIRVLYHGTLVSSAIALNLEDAISRVWMSTPKSAGCGSAPYQSVKDPEQREGGAHTHENHHPPAPALDTRSERSMATGRSLAHRRLAPAPGRSHHHRRHGNILPMRGDKMIDYAEITMQLLEIVEEQHETISEYVELLALGHKMKPDTASAARQHQVQIKKKLGKVRRSVTTDRCAHDATLSSRRRKVCMDCGKDLTT